MDLVSMIEKNQAKRAKQQDQFFKDLEEKYCKKKAPKKKTKAKK